MVLRVTRVRSDNRYSAFTFTLFWVRLLYWFWVRKSQR